MVDGLKGFPEAITASPHATIQTCIVHLLRHSLSFVTWKDRKQVAAALKSIYQALNADAAERALEAFAAGPWGQKHPPIVAAWRRQWTQVIPFFAHPLPDPARALHDQCDREPPHAAAEGSQNPRPLPE